MPAPPERIAGGADRRLMRIALAAAATAAILVVGFFGAPIVPAMLGAMLGGGLCWWRAHTRRRTT
jgi:hypothetical protein